MGGSAQQPGQGGYTPSQLPAGDMQGRIQGMQDKFRGMQDKFPGLNPSTQEMPEWLRGSQPMYSPGNHRGRAFGPRQGLARPITNAGSFSSAQASQDPTAQITAPAAVAGAPQSGIGGNAPPPSGQGTPQGSNTSQSLIQALRNR